MKAPVGSIFGSILSVLMFCSLPTSPLEANDSTAELATGGLVFVKNNHIEMLSEDLFTSPDEIRVRYRFLNTSNRDITVHVARVDVHVLDCDLGRQQRLECIGEAVN